MQFEWKDPLTTDAVSNKGATLRREIGNVTESADLAFHFGLKAGLKAISAPAIPLQVALTFRRPDGTRGVRIFSKTLKGNQNEETIRRSLSNG